MSEIQKENTDTPWIHEGLPIQSRAIPYWAIGYVYVITHIVEGKPVIYVGKKMLTTTRRKKIGIRAKKASGTRKKFETTITESNWSQYWGSSKRLLEQRKTGEGEWHREIIEWAYSKKNLSYLEMLYQIHLQVLQLPSYNDCIAGHYWRQDVDRDTHETAKNLKAILGQNKQQ